MQHAPSVPEIGFDHGRVAPDLGRAAAGDRAPRRQHGDVAAEAHHRRHLVADQEEGAALLGVGSSTSSVSRSVSAGFTPPNGSSSRTMSGLGHHRAHELEQLLLPARDLDAARWLQPARPARSSRWRAPSRGPVRQALRDRRHQHVVEQGQLVEDARHLEGAAEPAAGDPGHARGW